MFCIFFFLTYIVWKGTTYTKNISHIHTRTHCIQNLIFVFKFLVFFYTHLEKNTTASEQLTYGSSFLKKKNKRIYEGRKKIYMANMYRNKLLKKSICMFNINIKIHINVVSK